MDHIIYTDKEGRLVQCWPNTSEGWTTEAVIAKDCTDAVDTPVVVDDQTMPEQEFRNAWVRSGNTVVVDMPKARDIHRDNIRWGRKALFEIADQSFMRALETGDELAKTQAVSVKQLLRDAPAAPEIEAASTPQELMALWKESLLGPSPYSP